MIRSDDIIIGQIMGKMATTSWVRYIINFAYGSLENAIEESRTRQQEQSDFSLSGDRRFGFFKSVQAQNFVDAQSHDAAMFLGIFL